VTTHRLVPSDIDAEHLSELLADARAIPETAYSRSKPAAQPFDLSVLPVQRTSMAIPESTVSLLETAEHHFADFSR
jgi:hypothetical protein